MLKKLVISVFLFAALLIKADFVFAQPGYFSFQNITFDKGLPFNKECFTIFQDKSGFIWMGSDAGLHRFDGKNFRNYFHEQSDTTSLRRGFVNTIYNDSQNTIWIGTAEGADMFQKDKGVFVHVPMFNDNTNLEINQSVRGFFENKNGELFFFSHFFIYRFNREKICFEQTQIGLKSNEPEGFVIEKIIEENNYLICATNNQGIIVYNFFGERVKNLDKSFLESNTLKDLYKSKNGDYWIATVRGLNVVRGLDELLSNKPSKIESVDAAKGIIINKITEDKNGNIWAATDGSGMFQIDPKTLEIQKIKHNPDLEGSILSNKTALVFVDNQNNLWSFYNNYGFSITSLNNQNIFNTFTSINPSGKGPSGNLITSFAQDKDGDIWIGTDGDGLNLFNRNTFDFKHIKADPINKNSIPSNVILSLYVDSENQLWIGTYNGGLCKYDKKRDQFFVYRNDENNINSISSNNVSAITEDIFGNIYVLTISNGLNIIEKKTGKIKRIHDGYSNPYLLSHNGGTSLLRDSEGNIWVGTYWGLNKIDIRSSVIHKYIHNPSDTGSISSNLTNCIFEDSGKNIWIATPNGLNLFQKSSGTFKTFGKSEGLPDQNITSIIEDDHKNLWLGSLNGISKIDLSSFRIMNYGLNYNLPGRIMFPRSVMKAQNGEIYFGGNRGFSIVNPEQKVVTEDFPKLYFTELNVPDQPVKVGKPTNNRIILEKDITQTDKITLTHKEKSFSLLFAALDYANVSKIQYYYQLEEFDQNWRLADNSAPKATYTNLDAGKYRLLVKMVSGLDETESKPIVMEIKILRSMWLRWWAISIYFAVIFAVTAYFVQVSLARVRLKRTLQIEKIQHEKDKEISLLKEDFYTKVTHEFRTPLSLITGPIELLTDKYKSDNYLSGQLQIIKRNASRLMFLINELLDFDKTEKVGMKLAVSELNIVDYFKQVAQSFEAHAQIHKIRFNVYAEAPEIRVWFDDKKMDKVFYNLLSNAFKFTPDNGIIECELKTKDSFVSVVVSDNGIGIQADDLQNLFKKYFSTSNKTNRVGTGVGLYLSNEIIQLHKGSISVKNNPEGGAYFELLLPLGNEHLSDNEIKQTQVSDKQMFLIPGSGEAGSVSEERQYSGVDEEEYGKPMILIVEDNSDIRSFVKNILESDYEILEAENGRIGLEKAFEKIPDLIISDIMMPELDGKSLCNLLKNDSRTSHVPVILLTAKSGIEDKIEGLETGADSYITKPFHPRHLLVRVRKLLELRRLLIDKFNKQIDKVQSGLNYEPDEIVKKSVDELFLQSLIEIVEKRISDSKFAIEDLCTELGMNYLQLYRKVKAITNLSLKQLILTVRMKTAVKILETGKFNISEVAYDVGFTSPAYFSETFKKFFGMSPTEYLQKIDSREN